MLILIPIIASVAALIFAVFLATQIKKQPVENARAKEISDIIHDGAMVFLNKEYKILAVFVVIAAGLLVLISWKLAVSFILGAFFSGLAGNFGMRIATIANVRTAESAKKGLQDGLLMAFNSGSVMGMTVVGLGLLGISILYFIFNNPSVLYGFGFGASAIALFARVGGGIYTKAADVGADLVGKVETGIPEDDPRNPATIADNVGDNVGDVAGMGSDLLESYSDSIIAAMVIGSIAGLAVGNQAVFLPMILAATGIAASLLGNIVIKLFAEGRRPQNVLNQGMWASAIFVMIFAYPPVRYFSGETDVFIAFLVGLFAGVGIGIVTEYYTSSHNRPVQSIVQSSATGAGTNIISGLALGMKSVFWPIIIVVVGLFLSYYFAGIYGIAIAAVGMLSTLGITLAVDTYGPVADNAAGIAEMADLGEETRKRAEELDAVGNTTAAIGKGFAIGSAALTSIVLMVSFGSVSQLSLINLMETRVIIGLFIGGMLPFLFSSFTMNAVGRAASQMVEEVRRQFREIPGIMEGKGKPDYGKCIDISTSAALKEMIIPSLLAILSPIVIGFAVGPEALGGLLAGSIITGFLLAVMMANSGGAWDNAKKFIEAGNLGGKGSPAHKAAVIGDTVGDPFKDTAGPSLNILLKLMAIIALIIAPLI